jgi:hypothetical protein
MVMFGVRTLSQESCTRTFAFYTLMKDKTTNMGTGAFYVLPGAMLHAAPITLLKIMFVTTAVNQKRMNTLKPHTTALVLVSHSMITGDP